MAQLADLSLQIPEVCSSIPVINIFYKEPVLMLTVEIAKKEQRHRGFESLQNHRTNRMYPNEIVCNKYFDVTGVIT